MRAVITPETQAAEAAARVRRWIVGAKRVATVGRDFHPEKVAGYEVIHDRDRGEPVALVQRDRLVAAAGSEAALAAALLRATSRFRPRDPRFVFTSYWGTSGELAVLYGRWPSDRARCGQVIVSTVAK